MLAVTFALHSTARTLLFVMPPGYEPVIDPALPSSCGIFAPLAPANFTAYSRTTGAQPLPKHITECELKRLQEGKHVEVVMHLSDGVAGLTEPSEDEDPAHPGKSLSWWFFHLQVWFPETTPAKEDSSFHLHWSQARSSDWAGSLEDEGDPVLGDWDCVYSEWEGWGSCSARCGGGKQKLRRRILMEPPPGGSGANCTERVEMTVACNTHACIWPCEYTKEVVGECTAECGGGVRLTRPRWTGQHCPEVSDADALRREACNTQPCRSRCRLEDKWTVVTECSELCGPGFFWMMRKVIAKDSADRNCEPEWRRLPCLRQRCTPLTVLRPDQNIFPIAGDVFKAALLFKVPVLARVIQLNAPEGFQFGNLGGPCNVTEHSLDPYFDRCEVGVRASQAVLRLLTPLPPSMQGAYGAEALHVEGGGNATEPEEEFEDRHQFAIQVASPRCPEDRWTSDVLATAATCSIPPDENRWVIEFGEEGTTRWVSESTEGYPVFVSEVRGAVQSEERAPADRAKAQAAEARQASRSPSRSPVERRQFCSPRLKCKDGSECDSNGLCQSSRQQRGLDSRRAALP